MIDIKRTPTLRKLSEIIDKPENEISRAIISGMIRDKRIYAEDDFDGLFIFDVCKNDKMKISFAAKKYLGHSSPEIDLLFERLEFSQE